MRGAGNALPTDNTFTGQKTVDALGLMFYNARWYDAALGRTLQRGGSSNLRPIK